MMYTDKYLLLPKVVYFALYLQMGAFLPFLNVIMIDAGLTPTQAGFISGMRNCFVTAGILWGIMADSIGYRKLIYTALVTAAVLTICPMPFVVDNICRNKLTANISINNTSNNKNESSTDLVESCQEKLFYFFMGIIFTFSLFDQTMLSFIDTLVLNVVKRSKYVDSYGNQRMFGSIAFGISSLLVGVAIDHNNLSNLPKYFPGFLLFFILGVIQLPLCLILYSKTNWESKQKNTFVIVKTVKVIFKSVERPVFFIIALMMGVAIGLINGFLYPFMVYEVKSSDTLAGLCFTVNCLSESLILLFAKHFIKHLKGPTNCITVAAFSFFIRFFCMSYAYNAWLVICLQLLHSLGFGLYWAACIEKVNAFTPKDCLTTMICLLSVIQNGLASLIANVGGGYVYDKLNGRFLFRYASFIFAGLGVFLVLFNLTYLRRQTVKATTLHQNKKVLLDSNDQTPLKIEMDVM